MWAELGPWRPENPQTGMSHYEAEMEGVEAPEAYTHWFGQVAALRQGAGGVRENMDYVSAVHMMRTVTLAGYTVIAFG
jgi:hypothetical protein